MHTPEIQMPQAGRRRGRYSDEFKRQVIAACLEPGVSTAAIALANGLNANLARRWALRLHSATTPSYRRRQQRWHQFTPSLPSSPSNFNQCHQRRPSCNIPKTSNGVFNVGYRAGISRKSSSAMGTLPQVAKNRFAAVKICLCISDISPQLDSLNQKGVHHGKRY